MPLHQLEELSADEILQQAIGCHHSGSLAEAGGLYRCILAIDTAHPQANHNLGILALQSRCADAALSYLKAALDANPSHPQYWLSYADGLTQAHRLAEAVGLLAEADRRGTASDAIRLKSARLAAITANPCFDRRNWMPDLTGDLYTHVLDRLHQLLNPKTYLEIGVETGATLALARCSSIGIDPTFRFRDIDLLQRIVAKPSLGLYQMPSDDFFASHDPIQLLGAPIDFAFLDGMHRCEYLLRDFSNTERRCRPESVIALHDCLPLETPMAARTQGANALDPQRQGMWTGDVWRTALLLKRHRPDLQITVLDAAPTGLVLVTNLDPQSTSLADNHDRLVEEMLSWSLEEITLAGYYEEIGVEPEAHFRQPEQLRAQLQPRF